MSLGSLLAAAPALAADAEKAVSSAGKAIQSSSPPTLEFSTPSVPPEAVDSAVDQIIAAVKVSQNFGWLTSSAHDY